MRTRTLVLLAASLLVAAAIAVPFALAATRAATVGVQLKEYKVVPTTKSVKAGSVTFNVKDVGKLDHEFLVVKTNVAPGKLPVKNNQAVVKPLKKIGPLKPGKGGKVTLTLKRGKYVLLCNVKAHYQLGQYVGFTVK